MSRSWNPLPENRGAGFAANDETTNDVSAANRNHLDIPETLGRLPQFSGLGAEQMVRVAETTHLRKLAKGDVLFHAGDMPMSLFVVAFGQVKEAVASPRGGEKIVEIIGPKQCFGEAAIFIDRPYPFFVEALQDTLLLCVAKETILALLKTSPRFAQNMLAGLALRVHSLVADVEAYRLKSPEQRIVDYLIQQCDKSAGGDSDREIFLPAAKQAIASRLDMTPETFSRILWTFSELGVIRIHGKQLLIPDLNRLRTFALMSTNGLG